MGEIDRGSAAERLKGTLEPWYRAIADPQTAQDAVLERLVAGYSQTDYGRDLGAARVGGIDEHRRTFPIATYVDYKPLIERVRSGETRLLLYEDPIGWAITRGTTADEPKFIPMTPTDLALRVSASRAMMHYVTTTGRLDLFSGVNLNLNFPSVVGTIRVGEKDVEYGYSSGIYVKHVSIATPIRSLPTQQEVDSLGGGRSARDWEGRFELAYTRCREENVTLVGGVAPTAIRFGQYLRKTHGVYPKDLWKPQVMTLGSVPGINTRYAPALTALHGRAAIREVYGATEGMFGQQMDGRRAWVPNYDLFFFEEASARDEGR